jgi:hypothetical protein
MNRIFKPPFSIRGAISQGREKCQFPILLVFPFLLDEKPTVVPVGSAGEQSGRARKVPYGAARSNSERAAPSACVGRRFSAPQIVWIRSTRRAGARGGARVGRPRYLRILMITGGSSMLSCACRRGGDYLQSTAAVRVIQDYGGADQILASMQFEPARIKQGKDSSLSSSGVINKQVLLV